MKVTVITGPMFSGKSDELIKRLEKFRASEEAVKAFVHSAGVHHVNGQMRARSGREFPVKPIKHLYDIDARNATIIAIDEAQFFSEGDAWDFLRRVKEYFPDVKEVLFAGLDTDFRNEPFGPMGYLLALADEVVKLAWVCAECGSLSGTKTQRLNADGTPASWNEDVVVPGDSEKYETRCAACHEVR